MLVDAIAENSWSFILAVVIAAQSQEIFLPRICLSLFRLGVMFFLGVPGIESGRRDNQNWFCFLEMEQKRQWKELLQLLTLW